MWMDSLSLSHFRNRLAHVEALPQLVVLGLVCGLFTGLIIVAFRFAISWPLEQGLPGSDAENFEGLSDLWRFSLPIVGSLIIAIILSLVSYERARVGIPHVLERLGYHQGQLPLANALVQFVVGAITIISGHSAGREGPAVHLGAAGGSLLGQWLRLPNNSIRMLVGCGTAAAISASFNTPMAGVIFAMEVVMMEYSVIGFIPVTIASVTAALLMQLMLGDETAFHVPTLELLTLTEIPYVIFLGIILGLLSLLFNKTVLIAVKHIRIPLFARLLLAGLLTGTIALIYPQIMGLGYDSVTDILQGNYALQLLLGLTVAKLLVTAMAVGLGMPMGLIGPCLFIGAGAGASLGIIGAMLADIPVSDIGFYAMLGMGAMMAAVLQAPLAALMAVLELTHNPNVIFPAMVAIVTASLTCRHFFPDGSVFQAVLVARGLDWRRTPMDQILERASVTSEMHKNYSLQSRVISADEAHSALSHNHEWILISHRGVLDKLLSAADLQLYLDHYQPEPDNDKIDLLAIPGLRKDLYAIHQNATLKEALRELDNQNIDILYVQDDRKALMGIIQRDDIVRFFTERHEL
ncbi:MAG: chloride channel protein [Motiliproteus sp.]